MPPLYDDPRDAGRTRIKGTDPRVRQVTDRIGRGYRPSPTPPGSDIEDVRRAFLENRDMGFEDNMLELRPRRPRFPDDTQVRPGYRQFTHETDARNLDSIRREGIRPSRGGANFDDPRPQVYGSRANSVDDIPEGRVRIRYQVPEDSIIGRGTGGNNTVSSRGAVPRENVMSGYGPGGRVFDAGSKVLGIGGLINMLSSFVGGPYIQGPQDWVLNDLIAQNYGPGGIMDPYRDYEGPRNPDGTIPA